MSRGSTAAANLIPLIILAVVVLAAGAIGFVAYKIATEVKGHTKEKLQKKNILFSRTGMKVGVKEVTREQQEDSTQR